MPFPDSVKERMQAEYLRELRTLFFTCLDDLRPKAREELRDRVFKSLKSDINRLRSQVIEEANRENAELEEQANRGGNAGPEDQIRFEATPFSLKSWFIHTRRLGESSALADRIEAEVRDWAQDHHIEADWIVEAAIGLLDAWAAAGPKSAEPNWAISGSGTWSVLNPSEQNLSFPLRKAWWPPLETRTQARERILKEVRAKRPHVSFP